MSWKDDARRGALMHMRDEVVPPGPWAMHFAPPETVAILALPVSLTGLAVVTKALEGAYGEDLVIRTDVAGIDGWMLIARPETDEPDLVAAEQTGAAA